MQLTVHAFDEACSGYNTCDNNTAEIKRLTMQDCTHILTPVTCVHGVDQLACPCLPLTGSAALRCLPAQPLHR